MKRLWIALSSVCLGFLWWFVVAPFLIKPNSITTGIALVLLVLVTLTFHASAFRRFDRMLAVIFAKEQTGELEAGSTLFARNQRFRYGARLVEAAWAVGVASLVVFSHFYPTAALNHQYAIYVLTYFFGTVGLTGFLTWRDLRVLNLLHQMSESSPEVATLDDGARRH